LGRDEIPDADGVVVSGTDSHRLAIEYCARYRVYIAFVPSEFPKHVAARYIPDLNDRRGFRRDNHWASVQGGACRRVHRVVVIAEVGILQTVNRIPYP
jgi:hypothetical protein